MSERNPRVIRSQMGDLEAPHADAQEPERRLEAEEVERREREAEITREDTESGPVE